MGEPKKDMQKKIQMGNDREKLIVMPLQPARDQDLDGIGLGIHFFLGNLICLHQGLMECWFGWRVKKIFPEAGTLTDYCHGSYPFPDIHGLGQREKVRFWLEGNYGVDHDRISISLVLHDSSQRISLPGKFVLTFGDGLKGFREAFFFWLEDCGLGFEGRQTAQWPESITIPGLDALGRALEALYLCSVDKREEPIDMVWFDRARNRCPDSYLAHNLAGWGLYKNESHGDARDAFLTALALNSDGMGTLAGLMWCAVFARDREKALYYAMEKGRCRGEKSEKARAFVEKKFV